MPSIIVPRRPLGQKPPLGTQVNPSHPLAQGLVAGFALTEGGGSTLINLVGGTGSLGNGASWSTGPYGAAVTTDSGTTQGRTNLGKAETNGDMTVVCLLTPLRQANAFDVAAISKWNTGGSAGTNEWLLGLNYSNTATDYYPYFGVEIGTTASYVSDTTKWSVGVPLHIVGVRQGTTLSLYRNGVLVGTGTCGSGAINSVAARTLRLGEIDVNGQYNTNATYHAAYVYNRALSAAEVQQLYIDPYALLHAPRQVWAIATTGGGATTTFSPAADTLTISESRTSVQGASYADTPRVADLYAATLGLAPSDALTLADIVAVVAAILLQLGDTATASDSPAFLLGASAGDLLPASDGSGGQGATALADLLASGEALAGLVAYAATEQLATNDAFAAALTAGFADNLAPQDALARAATWAMADALSAADLGAFVTSALLSLVLSDAIAPQEALLWLAGLQPAADTIVPADGLTAAVATGVADLLALSDSATLSIAGQLLALALVDSMAASDSVASLLAGALADGLTAADLPRLLAAAGLGDGLAPADQATLSMSGLLILALLDGLGAIDGVAAVVATLLGDGLTASDALTAATGAAFVDRLPATDSPTFAQAVLTALVLADLMGVADSVTAGLVVQLADVLPPTDRIAALVGASLSDLLTSADLMAALSSSGVAAVRAAYRALTRATAFRGRARATAFRAVATAGGAQMAVQPITPTVDGPFLTSYDKAEPFTLDFTARLGQGEVIVGLACRVFSYPTALGSQGASDVDVTATLLQSSAYNVTTSVCAATVGNTNAIVGQSYRIVYVVTLSTGRVDSDQIPDIACRF